MLFNVIIAFVLEFVVIGLFILILIGGIILLGILPVELALLLFIGGFLILLIILLITTVEDQTIVSGSLYGHVYVNLVSPELFTNLNKKILKRKGVFCINCGQQAGSDAKFCINCGVEIGRPLS